MASITEEDQNHNMAGCTEAGLSVLNGDCIPGLTFRFLRCLFFDGRPQQHDLRYVNDDDLCTALRHMSVLYKQWGINKVFPLFKSLIHMVLE